MSYMEPCSNPWCNLTPRQREMVGVIRMDPAARIVDLAAELSVTERTVQKHLSDIYRVFGVDGRLQLVALLLDGQSGADAGQAGRI